MKTKQRRQEIKFTDEAFEELDQLQALTGLPTKAELIRYALRLFQWAMEETQNNDASLLLQNKDGRVDRIVFPFLRVSRRRKPPASAASSGS